MDADELRRIESLAQMPKRPSINDAAEYARSSGATLIGSTPLASPGPNKSGNSSDSNEDGSEPQVKLLKRATEEDVYELRSKVRVKKRYQEDGVPKSNLSDVRFKDAQSLLDGEESAQNPFRGFYVLFWLGVAVRSLNSIVNYYLEYGFSSQIVEILARDLIWIGLTDLAMYLCTYFVFAVHYLVKRGVISWDKSGWIFVSLFELWFVMFFMAYAQSKNYPWVGKIFLFLHSLVLLMKMHSYAFYNGYLWNIHYELTFSENALKKNTFEPHVEELLQKSIKFCKFEISSQSKTIEFPRNITLKNFFTYTMFPTVVYQIDYPRTERVRFRYLTSKICAVFGVIMLMVVLAQHSMYPIAMRAIALRELPLLERVWYYPKLLLDLVPPFLLMYILVFYLIWDAILNAIAELTCFGDREFYGPWWNCVSWDEFARLWNVPVHKFLLRHVYHSSISAFNCSKGTATVLTFLISSIVHELSMYVLFNKLRGYLLLLQMFQLPLAALSKTKWMREKKTLGNVIFWFGIATGPSLMCTLYLTF